MIEISREYICSKDGSTQERTKMVSKTANVRYSQRVFREYLQAQGMTFDSGILTCHKGEKCKSCGKALEDSELGAKEAKELQKDQSVPMKKPEDITLEQVAAPVTSEIIASKQAESVKSGPVRSSAG